MASILSQPQWVNSSVPVRCGCNLKLVIFKLRSMIDVFCISCEIILRWMPQDLTNKKVTIGSVNGLVPESMRQHQAITWINVDQVLQNHNGIT